jgi:hypothetical protein
MKCIRKSSHRSKLLPLHINIIGIIGTYFNLCVLNVITFCCIGSQTCFDLTYLISHTHSPHDAGEDELSEEEPVWPTVIFHCLGRDCLSAQNTEPTIRLDGHPLTEVTAMPASGKGTWDWQPCFYDDLSTKKIPVIEISISLIRTDAK